MVSGPADVCDDQLLADQRAYYRARAPEYDEWWQHQGRYDAGEQHRRGWEQQVGEIDAALRTFDATGRVLELAGGTGWWTARLAETASDLTVVDASSETLALNRARVGNRSNVTYVVADLFEWEPGHDFDVVFFSFWLSHVPRQRFARFWEMVGRCLGPAGRVFLIDSHRDPPFQEIEPHLVGEPSPADDVQRRTLNDGSEHRLVKIFYEPEELTDLLQAQGWSSDLHGTSGFIYGSATPVARPR